jgi:hypothetical protein
MSNNLFTDMSNTDVLIINILNTMYNDNLTIINRLLDQNNGIRQQIMGILNDRRNNNVNDNINSNVNISENDINNRRTNLFRNQNRNMTRNISRINRIITQPTNDNLRNSINRLFNLVDPLNNYFFDPVNIVPTQQQIQQSTHNVLYSTILNPINTSCPISLENFNDTSEVTIIIPCRHIYNTESLMAWFNTHTNCPVCRYDIRNYNSTASEEGTNETPLNEHNQTNEGVQPPTNVNNNLQSDDQTYILFDVFLESLQGFQDLSNNQLFVNFPPNTFYSQM